MKIIVTYILPPSPLPPKRGIRKNLSPLGEIRKGVPDINKLKNSRFLL